MESLGIFLSIFWLDQWLYCGISFIDSINSVKVNGLLYASNLLDLNRCLIFQHFV